MTNGEAHREELHNRAFQEKLTVQSTHSLMCIIASMALQISTADIATVINAINRQETLQPILDPTAFMAAAPHITDHRRLAEAFLEFRQAIGKLTGEGK